MFRPLLLLPLFFSTVSFGQNIDGSDATDPQGITRCGTVTDASSIQEQEATFQAKGGYSPSETDGRWPASIQVHYHVIYEEKKLESGYIPLSQIYAQNEVLDRTYAASSMGIRFYIGSINYYRNSSWFNSAGPETPFQDDMKKKLRKGGVADLNVYTVGFTTVGHLLGYASYPWSYEERPFNDGVVILYSSLPDGTMVNYNLGATLIHEAGHWVGLYHTFENGCNLPGDMIFDTPFEATPAFGCPVGRDTCEGGGLDPINNYMDYTYDSCMTEFTKGQSNRTAAQLLFYRGINTGFHL